MIKKVEEELKNPHSFVCFSYEQAKGSTGGWYIMHTIRTNNKSISCFILGFGISYFRFNNRMFIFTLWIL